jgi:probable rRNA maturation factor
MSVDLFVANEQDEVSIDLERWTALSIAVLAARGVTANAEMSLLFVDETTIAHLNEEFLGKVGPTDVLSFPIEDEETYSGRVPDQGGTGPGSTANERPVTLIGDVLVCPAVALRNAIEHDTSDDDEFALLIVHGILHLLGFDHVVDTEAEVMEALERELLRAHFDPAWGRPRSER